ncbi:GntR family transcriptional regulator [Azospirillum halopraeferens]|uniref:GntR family transcriptional regulator n=1 Tax=Azospirillum halopraeferens TaxID=34010 RepID=UPI0004117FD6|nr:GntR family transcriptional regulator [Azospirillum halopraeferens]
MSEAPETTLQKIDRDRLWGLAQAQLRDALLGGRFEPGRSLTLRYLAEIFGTSITPVRDAVMRLVAQGVLEQGARNSAVVPDVGAATLRHLTVVRTELEGRAAREAALRPDLPGLARLEETLGAMRSMIAERRLDTYLDIHRQFHFGIYEMAGNPVLYDMIENLWLRCGPVLTFVLPEYVLTLKGTDHHRAILDAIRRGDAAVAEAETTADIREAETYLLSLADAAGRIRKPGAAR